MLDSFIWRRLQSLGPSFEAVISVPIHRSGLWGVGVGVGEYALVAAEDSEKCRVLGVDPWGLSGGVVGRSRGHGVPCERAHIEMRAIFLSADQLKINTWERVEGTP